MDLYVLIQSVWRPQVALLHVKCLANIPEKDAILEETEEEQNKSLSESDSLGSISAYTWCAGLGALGFLETTYLTYLKLTNSDVFCPLGSSSTSCSSILNSQYSLLFGIYAVYTFYKNCTLMRLQFRILTNDTPLSPLKGC